VHVEDARRTRNRTEENRHFFTPCARIHLERLLLSVSGERSALAVPSTSVVSAFG
jgi:hypothetical protein